MPSERETFLNFLLQRRLKKREEEEESGRALQKIILEGIVKENPEVGLRILQGKGISQQDLLGDVGGRPTLEVPGGFVPVPKFDKRGRVEGFETRVKPKTQRQVPLTAKPSSPFRGETAKTMVKSIKEREGKVGSRAELLRRVIGEAQGLGLQTTLGEKGPTFKPTGRPIRRPSQNTVKVRLPDGRIGNIPKEKLGEALKLGAEEIE